MSRLDDLPPDQKAALSLLLTLAVVLVNLAALKVRPVAFAATHPG